MNLNSGLFSPKKIFLLIIIVLLYSPSFAGGGNSPFIDLDGDGFNDTPPVLAVAGITDSAAPDTNSEKYISFEISGDVKNELPPTCSSYFELRQYESRSLVRNRCGLDADLSFGPGSATGNIALSGAGSICSGGSCHR